MDNDLCNCGSKQPRYPIRDGYGIFLTYVCDHCVKEKRAEFREDIQEQYDAEEPIDAE